MSLWLAILLAIGIYIVIGLILAGITAIIYKPEWSFKTYIFLSLLWLLVVIINIGDYFKIRKKHKEIEENVEELE